MSEYTTREMVSGMINETIKKMAMWSIGVFGISVFAGAMWVGSINSDVKHLKEDVSGSSDKIERLIQVSVSNQTLLRNLVEEVKSNRQADERYRETTTKNIQEFYRKNPEL